MRSRATRGGVRVKEERTKPQPRAGPSFCHDRICLDTCLVVIVLTRDWVIALQGRCDGIGLVLACFI